MNPSAATGPSQALTFVYSDPAGFADIASTQVTINSCAIQLTTASGQLALTNDGGTGVTTAALGSANVLRNSQCIVNAASSYKLGSGNFLTVTLFVTMKNTGSVNVSSSVTSTSPAATSAVAQLGTWNVTIPASFAPVSVAPFTGTAAAGTYQNFTFTFADPLGVNDISGALIVLNSALQGASGCYILYGHGNNLLSLATDDASTSNGAVLGTATTLSNSQCTLDVSKSFMVQTGNTINLTIAASFSTAFKNASPRLYSFVNLQDPSHALSGWFVESRFTLK